jgi:hypothetical protein
VALLKQDPQFQFDPSPLFALEVTAEGRVRHWMAFDPAYGPESQDQIDWHVRAGTEGAQRWEVGQPVKVKAVR